MGEKVKLINGNCLETLENVGGGTNYCIVTDPPFNIGYHYRTYKDKLRENEYFDMLASVFGKLGCPFVVIHYPESLYKIALRMNQSPSRVVSWVYNSNTARQHRDIAYFGISPDFSLVKQPYKNPTDKRVQKLIKQGKTGCNLYDWWNINQVKNVSREKTKHPCQMPLEVMEKVIGIIPDDYTIIDPFMGSGTTGVACKSLGRNFIGVEIDEEYFKIAQGRIFGAS